MAGMVVGCSRSVLMLDRRMDSYRWHWVIFSRLRSLLLLQTFGN